MFGQKFRVRPSAEQSGGLRRTRASRVVSMFTHDNKHNMLKALSRVSWHVVVNNVATVEFVGALLGMAIRKTRHGVRDLTSNSSVAVLLRLLLSRLLRQYRPGFNRIVLHVVCGPQQLFPPLPGTVQQAKFSSWHQNKQNLLARNIRRIVELEYGVESKHHGAQTPELRISRVDREKEIL